MLHAVHCFRVFLPALALVAVLTSAVRAHAAPPPEPAQATPSAVEALLAQIQPDQLSPREALDALYQLKAVMGKPTQA